MLCPWCMHCGAEDEEYYFDRELYCGICAQQMPSTDADWLNAFRAMEPDWYVFVEQELNRIGAGRSGLATATRQQLAAAVDAFAALRLSGGQHRPLPDDEYARWVKFACTYFAPARD